MTERSQKKIPRNAFTITTSSISSLFNKFSDISIYFPLPYPQYLAVMIIRIRRRVRQGLKPFYPDNPSQPWQHTVGEVRTCLLLFYFCFHFVFYLGFWFFQCPNYSPFVPLPSSFSLSFLSLLPLPYFLSPSFCSSAL